MPTLIKFIAKFLLIVAALVHFGLLALYAYNNSLIEALQLFSPFNMGQWIFVFLSFGPPVALHQWGEKLERQKLRKKHQKSDELNNEINANSSADPSLIIQAYGRYVEENPNGVDILDVSVLPYPKVKIINAFLLEIYLKNSKFDKHLLKGMVVDLAYFQTGIGNEPLSPLGGDLSSIDLSNLDEVQRSELVMNFVRNPKRERYQKELVAVEKEQVDLTQLVLRAETSRIQIRA